MNETFFAAAFRQNAGLGNDLPAVATWRMLPASAPTFFVALATTVINAPVLSSRFAEF